MVKYREANFIKRKPWKFGVRLNDIQNKNFLADFRVGGHEIIGHYIRADIIMGASGSSAQIMADQITSNRVDLTADNF